MRQFLSPNDDKSSDKDSAEIKRLNLFQMTSGYLFLKAREGSGPWELPGNAPSLDLPENEMSYSWSTERTEEYREEVESGNSVAGLYNQ